MDEKGESQATEFLHQSKKTYVYEEKFLHKPIFLQLRKKLNRIFTSSIIRFASSEAIMLIGKFFMVFVSFLIRSISDISQMQNETSVHWKL